MLMPLQPRFPIDEQHPQARACAVCEVRRTALFGALDAASLEQIHTHIAAPVLGPEEPLYARGRTADAVYTIRSGVVRFERFGNEGSRRIVRLAGRGDLIGQEALLGQPYEDDAIACTPVVLCRIPAPLVDELGEVRRELLRELMRRWQQALEEATRWSSDLRAGAARRRVLELLADLARYPDDRGRIWLPTRALMGDMLDLTEETASRIVSQLRREGVLHEVRHGQARLDADRLATARRAG